MKTLDDMRAYHARNAARFKAMRRRWERKHKLEILARQQERRRLLREQKKGFGNRKYYVTEGGSLLPNRFLYF